MFRKCLAIAAFSLCSTGLGCFAVAMLLTGCGQKPGPGSHVPAADPPQVAAKAEGLLVGTPACSGRGCHGDFEQPQTEPYRFAYTRFLHHDPHTNAFRSLESDLGQSIGRTLGIEPTSDARCLACHTTPQAATGQDEVAMQERAFGVGCESCHGAARDWLVEHREAGWTKKPGVLKEVKGMNALGSAARRAETCAGCHVGAPADEKRGLPLRDMNHDMIAAGHPRLLFEYGAYLANLPRHWVEKDRRESFEVRAWLVGQFASAKAAMDLLADRAARAEKGGLWPELAEHDCYACHHDLHGQSWRQERGSSPKAGAVGANRWYLALLPTLHEALHNRPWGADEVEQRLARRLPPPGPVREAAVRMAKGLADLAAEAERLSVGPVVQRQLRGGLLAFGGGGQWRGWDEYEQAALGLGVLAGPERRPQVRALLRQLAWPEGRSGPPADFPADVRKLFEGVGR